MGKYSGLNLDEIAYVEYVNHLEHYELERKTPYIELINNALNGIQNSEYDGKYVIYNDGDDEDGTFYYEIAKIIKGLGDKYFIDRVQDDYNYLCYEGDITECKCLVLSAGVFNGWKDSSEALSILKSGE